MATIAVLGTLDTKGQEHQFVAECIRRRGHQALLIDVGTLGPPQVPADITREDVAALADVNLAELTSRADRGECVRAMTLAAPLIVSKLARERRIDAVISLGGGGGTAIGSAAMRSLPIGFPKVLVSTMAGGNTAPYIGTSDIVMMPCIVDLNGLNRISRMILSRAAGAVCGMTETEIEVSSSKPLIVASMFGNTTECVTAASQILSDAGYEVLTFHATGTGGRTMEALIDSGVVSGVLDITTTELADELVGGVLTAGPDRLTAAGRAKVPSIVVPGCLDMINFGEPSTIPPVFSGRTFYPHNPQVTLMRTTSDECRQLGMQIADKLNQYSAPVTVLIPEHGVSVIGAPGGPFHDPSADQVLFKSLTDHLAPQVRVIRMNCHINAPEFSSACAAELLRLMLEKASSAA